MHVNVVLTRLHPDPSSVTAGLTVRSDGGQSNVQVIDLHAFLVLPCSIRFELLGADCGCHYGLARAPDPQPQSTAVDELHDGAGVPTMPREHHGSQR